MTNTTTAQNIEIVIGSWGSYNACNSRALGSKWLNLADYNCGEEIEAKLKEEGFELEGIDEELFVQDIEAPFDIENTDYINPFRLFEILQEGELLTDEYKQQVAAAYCEVEGFDSLARRIEEDGSRWDDDIILYADMTLAEVAEELAEECGELNRDSWLMNYIDWEAVGRDMRYDGYTETENGVLYIG